MTLISIFPRATQALLSILFIFLIVPIGPVNGATAQDNSATFPRFKAIDPNVTFWEKIYASYSLNQAVIHDSKDLSKIYEVIPMLDQALPGANRLNNELQKQARASYSNLLKELSGKAPATDLEKRIASLFKGKDREQQMMRAADNVRSQSGQKERFLTGVIVSGMYMDDMKKIFRSHQLPEELAYLPHVESSFNTRAYSKFGAAGIWQFTRTTGKQYLTINYEVDERLDPIIATRAAARYLQNSYRLLNSWPLALTSYNYGLSGMLRAVKAEGGYVEIFHNYNEGHFKFASKNFYSEFLAALKVAQDYESNMADLISAPQTSNYFTLPGYVHIEDLARHFKITIDQLKSLNPALRPPIFSGEKLVPRDYSLRLPQKRNIASLISSFPSSKYFSNQKPSSYHRVKEGDTAGSIAKQYGVPLKSLLQTNNLDNFATIYLRQRLKIPHVSVQQPGPAKNVMTLPARPKIKSGSTSDPDSLPVLSANKKIRPATQDDDFIPPKDPTVYSVFSTYKKNGDTYGSIVVQPEESLGLYADWLGTTSESLARLNGIKTESTVTPGQKLKLVFKQLAPGQFEIRRLDFLQETEEDFFSAFTIVGRKIYQVSDGDTLWDLCYNKFDIPLWLLERYNSTINLAKLTRKQELVVPIVQSI